MADKPKVDEPVDEAPRYAAYDNTYLRFIGSVLETKKAVTDQDVVKAAKDAGNDVEVREV